MNMQTPENTTKSTTPPEDREGKLRVMILHLLTVYPVISPTMLQNALGPMTKASTWRPILDELIEEGLVILTYDNRRRPHGRYNAYKKLQLTEAGAAAVRTTH